MAGRLQCSAVHVFCALSAIAAYVIHNSTCWSYAYSTFGAAELLMVVSSVSIRLVLAMELRTVRVTIADLSLIHI